MFPLSPVIKTSHGGSVGGNNDPNEKDAHLTSHRNQTRILQVLQRSILILAVYYLLLQTKNEEEMQGPTQTDKSELMQPVSAWPFHLQRSPRSFSLRPESEQPICLLGQSRNS